MATPWYEILRNTLLSGVAPGAAAQAAVAAARTYAVAIAGFAELTHASGTATLDVGAPTLRDTASTTGATTATFTVPLTASKTTVLAYRIVGRSTVALDASAIIREGSKTVVTDASNALTLKVGGSGSEVFGEGGDTGILYANDAMNFAAADIAWTSTGIGGVVFTVTGVAGQTIAWTFECWKREY